MGRRLNLGDPTVSGRALAAAGFDPERMRESVAEPGVKERLEAAAEEPVARGAFGAPTSFVGAEILFGQDRLAFV